jgi:hypothetical protein
MRPSWNVWNHPPDVPEPSCARTTRSAPGHHKPHRAGGIIRTSPSRRWVRRATAACSGAWLRQPMGSRRDGGPGPWLGLVSVHRPETTSISNESSVPRMKKRPVSRYSPRDRSSFPVDLGTFERPTHPGKRRPVPSILSRGACTHVLPVVNGVVCVQCRAISPAVFAVNHRGRQLIHGSIGLVIRDRRVLLTLLLLTRPAGLSEFRNAKKMADNVRAVMAGSGQGDLSGGQARGNNRRVDRTCARSSTRRTCP